jgi:nitrate reductase NapAB chaperone NapD
MPIKSYLVHSHPGKSGELAARLATLPGCTAVPAHNRDALVLVTDTPSEDADRDLRVRLERAESLMAMTLVSAFQPDDDLISLGGPDSQ